MLASYSPELNLTDRLWLHLRDNHLSQRAFRTTDEIIDSCCSAWNWLLGETAFGLRRAGREFAGKCPNCGYKTGFAVADRKGGLPLVYCHAGGCSQQDLIEAADGRSMAGCTEGVGRSSPASRRRLRPTLMI